MRRASIVAAVLVGTAAAMLPVSTASAHDSLVAASPADGESVSEVSTVDLEFSGVLLQLGEVSNRVEVTDAAGRHYETACVEVDESELHSPVALGAAGEYTVTYKIVSSDGHPVSDSYVFDYAPAEPAEGADVAEGSEQSPCAGGSVSEATEAGSAADPAAGDYTWAITAAIAIGVLAVVITAVVLLVGRRRGDDEDGESDEHDDGSDESSGPPRD